MNVTCPSCNTTYRVDPRKIPAGGVVAQCARCPNTFEVKPPAPEPVVPEHGSDKYAHAGHVAAPGYGGTVAATHGEASGQEETSFDAASSRTAEAAAEESPASDEGARQVEVAASETERMDQADRSEPESADEVVAAASELYDSSETTESVESATSGSRNVGGDTDDSSGTITDPGEYRPAPEFRAEPWPAVRDPAYVATNDVPPAAEFQADGEAATHDPDGSDQDAAWATGSSHADSVVQAATPVETAEVVTADEDEPVTGSDAGMDDATRPVFSAERDEVTAAEYVARDGEGGVSHEVTAEAEPAASDGASSGRRSEPVQSEEPRTAKDDRSSADPMDALSAAAAPHDEAAVEVSGTPQATGSGGDGSPPASVEREEPVPVPGHATEQPIGGAPVAASGVDSPGRAPLPPAPFGSSDPHQRARRLARALVSDIVVYHPDRRMRSLRQGTLRQEFREEIRKSWEEYAGQVGNQLARETSYFRDALNEILAEGAQIF